MISETPSWEDTFPHFSMREKGEHITAIPLGAPRLITGFMVVTFVAWVPSGVGAALFVAVMSEPGPDPKWFGICAILYSFLPMMIADAAVDEARDTLGQRSAAKRITAVPALAGAGFGILGVAVWTRDGIGLWLALAAVACGLCAAVAGLLAWSALRYTRRRREWIHDVRRRGRRVPGVLSEVGFLNKWSDTHPLFTVVVDFPTAAGTQRVTANMVTTTTRVPRVNTAVVVTVAPDEPEVLIELDYARRPAFDPDTAEYAMPTGN
ncbi:Uncharacterised protein [Mycolicibacterium phlei]|jgi:phosphatidylglycerophosphate synthase|uniref:Uncharacterized protein n=1 Tax=Mycolicibacterium phlei DSM 43239 = CCUG 21000 TaxID=1226750 RepID=A0A5N5V415_MYCPH|nr:hypothetical protein [Mycolicibacterium phlei]VEG08389.1 Uncharacterised protein [Mycobacteroides chelonae]AMO60269.1 hypothetical protein MPHLCCUG_01444 [Mycolicibacterium phlei]KAB7756683.1 hypothetical protein MPHL21000_11520 [Mycolicibacterium phlei DSM 43239 = CCUG 21000]KXW63571.1 hypothetical protein MPHL43239_16670 [Mycolicibacterium phlei DSM 43239 = CCUG 21000]KXW66427.1 hypothetical protein MPHL43072_04695 [Mycolicibacterium phlei DSM 43072]